MVRVRSCFVSFLIFSGFDLFGSKVVRIATVATATVDVFEALVFASLAGEAK